MEEGFFLVYHTDGTNVSRKEAFRCSVCVEPCVPGPVYISPDYVNEKACYMCGPEQGWAMITSVEIIEITKSAK